MSLLAMTAAVTLSAANPMNDVGQDLVDQTYAPPAFSREAPNRDLPMGFEDPRQVPFDEEGEAPPDDEGYEEGLYYEEAPAPTSEESWTFDGTGTVPLRYGIETPEGRYEYDLANDEITFRIRNY